MRSGQINLVSGYRRRRSRGFTLMEAAIVTVIVGVGTVAMMQLLAAGSMANRTSYQLTTGLNLANNIREMAQSRTYDQTVAATPTGLHNADFSPPRDAMNQPINDLPGWRQRVLVQRVDENNVTSNGGTTSPIARVTVTVLKDNVDVCAIDFLTVDTSTP